MEHTELYAGLLDAFEEIAVKENNLELKKAVEEQRRLDLVEGIITNPSEEGIGGGECCPPPALKM